MEDFKLFPWILLRGDLKSPKIEMVSPTAPEMLENMEEVEGMHEHDATLEVFRSSFRLPAQGLSSCWEEADTMDHLGFCPPTLSQQPKLDAPFSFLDAQAWCISLLECPMSFPNILCVLCVAILDACSQANLHFCSSQLP